jgi:hypothetical protein
MRGGFVPGDVVTLQCGTSEHHRAMWIANSRGDGAWYCEHGGGHPVTAPYQMSGLLVVIDPEDREQVERVTSLFYNERTRGDRASIVGGSTDAMQAALRSLVAPEKPAEPTGIGALVEADFATNEGKGFGPAHWARAGDGSWRCLTDGMTSHATAWPFLSVVKVLSEGVTTDE